ncbi:unnamed protein product [Linum tenue]|uniref:Sulfite exporter TauE/SafE family protein n=1 Tax=Linum tenue TaxID=586396 RepID=A0AAV0M6Q7_9ROSI|nr:unnamed protein product [Linum tenue]
MTAAAGLRDGRLRRKTTPAAVVIIYVYCFLLPFGSAEGRLRLPAERVVHEMEDYHFLTDLTAAGDGYFANPPPPVINSFWQSEQIGGYQHVWPEFRLGWKAVAAGIIGSLGAAFGSAGGVGGGGIFVPMLTLVVGFDPKSAAAISKCMIMGAAISTVYYNLRHRHPTISHIPIIDYDLALLLQPTLMLGISFGVAFNVIFADWMVTVLLIFLFIDANEGDIEYKPLRGDPQNDIHKTESHASTCSTSYWLLNFFQIPVAVGASGYHAVTLYKGHRVIASAGDEPGGTNLKLGQLLGYGAYGMLAGIVAGLLGVGGGSIMGPLFLELGVPPQVATATATFAMLFSSSMSVVEYYLLDRFPVPYALYLTVVATMAAYVGQHVLRWVVSLLGRASIIIFILAAIVFGSAITLVVFVSADRRFRLEETEEQNPVSGFLVKASDFFWENGRTGYQRVWPELEFGWQIVLGTTVGFLGAAFGSVGGVGGGGIFVPMLSLIVGFDPKSSTAISKCMIMGAAASTVYYNLRLRHPTLDMPIIDYDLALLIQPMLMLGISIGVTFNVIFADWMVTVLLIVLFVVTSSKAFLKGVETWKKETMMKKEAARRLESTGNGAGDNAYRPLPSGPQNVCWKELGLLVFVWVAFLILQIAKNGMATCSANYWVLNLLQIPVSLGVSGYEAFSLYKGHRMIASKGDQGTNLQVHQLVTYCACGILAGVVGGLLGLGGGFIMGPLFLELGIPPQVSSATATFAMTFSSSMSVVEYYLLNRFPVPYAVYFFAVATVAAIVGQHVVKKLIIVLGRSSLIIFILAFTIFVSAISLGGVGISNMIGKIERQEYMGFENLCKHDA